MLSKISLFETVISRGEGVLPYKRLMGTGCVAGWGRIFTTGYDYSGVVFLIELLVKNRVAHFRIFWGERVLHIYGKQTYQNVCTVDASFNLKNGSIHDNRK